MNVTATLFPGVCIVTPPCFKRAAIMEGGCTGMGPTDCVASTGEYIRKYRIRRGVSPCLHIAGRGGEPVVLPTRSGVFVRTASQVSQDAQHSRSSKV
jgi:hypothetical protein